MTLPTREEIRALIVGPDEVLILTLDPDTDQEDVSALVDNLEAVGLTGRALIVSGNVEMKAVKRDAGT